MPGRVVLRSRAVRAGGPGDRVRLLPFSLVLRDRPELTGRGDTPDVETRLTGVDVSRPHRIADRPRIRRWDVPVALISAILGLVLGQLLF